MNLKNVFLKFKVLLNRSKISTLLLLRKHLKYKKNEIFLKYFPESQFINRFIWKRSLLIGIENLHIQQKKLHCLILEKRFMKAKLREICSNFLLNKV